MNNSLQIIVFVTALCVLTSELRSSDQDDNRWDLHLYLEDHEITTGDALGVAVSLENRAKETRSIRSGVVFRRVIAPTTQRADQAAPTDQEEHKPNDRRAPAEGLVPEQATNPWIEVVIEGPFRSVDRPWLKIRSELLTTIHLEQNQHDITTDLTPSDVFAAGEYTIRAVLYDGTKELASSKRHRLKVNQETDESQQRRLRIFKGLPPGTKLKSGG
jgi:hypothetical protein